MPPPYIVLALDIDDTLITGRDLSGVYFNGSSQQWLTAIQKLQAYCRERGVTLIPQVISAKEDCEADITVDEVMRELHQVLQPRNSNGDVLRRGCQVTALGVPVRFRSLHHTGHTVEQRNYANKQTGTIFLRERVIEAHHGLLPPIHLVLFDHLQDGFFKTSKAHVLHYISQFLGGIPKESVFLVDDDVGNERNVASGGGDGSVPVFQFVSSAALLSQSRSMRQANTLVVIERFSRLIRNRADILEPGAHREERITAARQAEELRIDKQNAKEFAVNILPTVAQYLEESPKKSGLNFLSSRNKKRDLALKFQNDLKVFVGTMNELRELVSGYIHDNDALRGCSGSGSGRLGQLLANAFKREADTPELEPPVL